MYPRPVRRREHPLTIALVEAFARRAGLDADDLWAYLDRRKAPPREVRDELVAAFFPRVPPESFLPSGTENSTIRTMSTAEIVEPRRGRPASVGKLAAALTKAGVTLTEIAAAAKRSPASVRSWAYPKGEDSHRPAPRAVVEMFRDEYGIPLAVWPEITG